MPHPYSADEIEAAKAAALEKNGLTDAYVRPVIWRGSGPDMGVASARNPVHMAIAVWEWGAYYGDAEDEGRRSSTSRSGSGRARRRSPASPRPPAST